MSKRLKEICDAVLNRLGLGKETSYFGGNDETLAYLANESLGELSRMQWQQMRRTGTIPMTVATTYPLPDDMLYIVADTLNAVGQERFIQLSAPTNEWWYFKTHQPSGIRYKVRINNNMLEVLNPDPGIDLQFEYITRALVFDNTTMSYKNEFTNDNDTCILDSELLIKDLKWRYGKEKGKEGWENDKMIFNNYLQTVRGQESGATTLHFGHGNPSISSEPWTDLYV